MLITKSDPILGNIYKSYLQQIILVFIIVNSNTNEILFDLHTNFGVRVNICSLDVNAV